MKISKCFVDKVVGEFIMEIYLNSFIDSSATSNITLISCRCEQQYRLHRLLAFDPTNECRGIFSDWFRFPSCCVCRCYLNEYELMMLNAAGQDPPPNSNGAQSRTSDRIRSPRKLLLEQLVDGPDVQGVDDIHFFYKQGFNHEHNHGAQPRRKRASLFNNKMP